MISQDFQIGNFLENMMPSNMGNGHAPASEGGFSSIMGEYLNTAKLEGKIDNICISPEDMRPGKRRELIEQLRKHLSDKGIDQAIVDKKALQDLKKLLIDAGFDSESVERFISELKSSMKGHRLTLEDLFMKIFLMDSSDAGEEQDRMLEISALPFIENILSMLGLEQDKIKEVIAGAKVEGKGIDLASLVANLKQVLNQIKQDSHNLPDHATLKQIEQLLKQMGIEKDPKNGPMTLEKFAAELEALAGRNSAKLIAEDFNRFIKNIHSDGNTAGQIKQSTVNGKNLIINPLLSAKQQAGIQNANSKEKKTLKALGQSKTENLNLQTVIKDTLKNTVKNNENSFLNNHKAGAENGGQSLLKETDSNSLSFEHMLKNRAANAGEQSTAGSAAKPGGRTLPSYVLDQVGRQILRSVQNNENAIRLQLKPPQLGRLQMSIESTAAGLRVNIIAENPITREMLLSNSGELRSALMDQGVHLEKINVQLSYNFDQSMANAKQELNHSNGRKSARFRLEDAGEIEDLADEEQDDPGVRNDGILDLVA